MTKKMTGNEIRQTFIDFFVEHGHTAVPSMSLVPGGDSTLLFTNSGMVQFKDVFLGRDKKPYKRAVDSQKCLRVAGKHNDLDDVGQDDTHHTFFEMLGNWSFGDYYKKEAIAWSWQLLTDVWGLPKDKLYATCFEDDSDAYPVGKGNIPRDDEAADAWKEQPGFNPEHVLFFGRKENFWQMAETGPCGPCSEIHIDLGEERDNLRGTDHRCGVNGECTRYLELWNNVFIQYNLFDDGRLEPLPAKHVDTGMGFERIVSVLQGVDSNYKTDLFTGSLDILRSLTGHTEKEMLENFTPYRVICDHVRSAAFLIADGVVPGNGGRNYVTRMIIRRAARFGTKIGLNEPFLAKVAQAVIDYYGDFYPELRKSQTPIFEHLTREEIRFARTVEAGTAHLENLLSELRSQNTNLNSSKIQARNLAELESLMGTAKPEDVSRESEHRLILDGHKAFDLYATYGLPFEISRDIAREQGLDIDETGFNEAKEKHSKASGGGKAMGKMGGEDAEFFAGILKDLQSGRGGVTSLGEHGVEYDPYTSPVVHGKVLALVVNGESVQSASLDDQVEVILPKTGFYIESGGQVEDTGYIRSSSSSAAGRTDNEWQIEITGVRRASAGVIVHAGTVISGQPKVGDLCIAEVDLPRRHDIMRNHTATHLLHKALHIVLGEHARQAGSLVAPDRLRFDFTHPEAMTPEQVERVEQIVNDAVAADMEVFPKLKSREDAIAEGAMALFGEKYGETVRTISILGSSGAKPPTEQLEHELEEAVVHPTALVEQLPKYSYELCGGTHLDRTSDIGAFLIVSEGSVASNVRRIEAVTGRGAYELIKKRFKVLKQAASILKSGMEEVPQKVQALDEELNEVKKDISSLRMRLGLLNSEKVFEENKEVIDGITVVSAHFGDIDRDTLLGITDKFRQTYSSTGGTIIASGTYNDKPYILASSTDSALEFGLDAGQIAKVTGVILGGSGGGRPTLGQAGGKDASKLPEAREKGKEFVRETIKKKRKRSK